MEQEHELVKLAKLAQQGHEDARNRLARHAEAGLKAYIYRMTLNREVTEDLCQEVLAEMFGKMGDLKNVGSFRAWMYAIATNAVNTYRRKRKQRAAVSASVFYRDFLDEHADPKQQDGLNHLLQQELSKTVMTAMRGLRERHRAVLALRVFEQLRYSEIAVVMQCSELGARMLFLRARSALRKRLSDHGISKTLMIMCLGLFGKLTAPSEAAGEVTVTAASTKVGVGAVVLGAICTKTGIGAFAAAVIVTAASVGGVKALSSSEILPERSQVSSFEFATQMQSATGGAISSLSMGLYDHKIYFPKGPGGPMFTRTQRWDPRRTVELCTWLQNDRGNYYYHTGQHKVYINNYRPWTGNFRVLRLPTDDPDLADFIAEVEGDPTGVSYRRDRRSGLLLNAVDTRFVDVPNFRTDYKYNQVDPSMFSYDWPDEVPVVDERDQMHTRGWTYFTVEGQFGRRRVTGYGRLPFVYDSYVEKPPWLVLYVGQDLIVTDCNQGACVSRPDGTILASYPPESFFAGLSEPWLGIHTVDVLRRRAAKERIWFDTALVRDYRNALITMVCDETRDHADIVYVVNMEKDIVERIRFRVDKRAVGSLTFDYLQEVDDAADRFIEPAAAAGAENNRTESQGMLWLVDLARGSI